MNHFMIEPLASEGLGRSLEHLSSQLTISRSTLCSMSDADSSDSPRFSRHAETEPKLKLPIFNLKRTLLMREYVNDSAQEATQSRGTQKNSRIICWSGSVFAEYDEIGMLV